MTAYLLTEPHRLSGGQKQRVAIAGIIAISPKVLILDEATVMLDPRGRNEIMETINQLTEQEELSLITITNDLQEVTQVERVIVLNKCEIWMIGSIRYILRISKDVLTIGITLYRIYDD